MRMPSDFRPLNAHGKAMPKFKERPMDAELWQVWATDKETKALMPVSPATIKDGAEMLMGAIMQGIESGKIRFLTNVHLACVKFKPKIDQKARQTFLNTTSPQNTGYAEEIIPLSSLF